MVGTREGGALLALLFLPILVVVEGIEMWRLGFPRPFMAIDLNTAALLLRRAPEVIIAVLLVLVAVQAALVFIVFIGIFFFGTKLFLHLADMPWSTIRHGVPALAAGTAALVVRAWRSARRLALHAVASSLSALACAASFGGLDHLASLLRRSAEAKAAEAQRRHGPSWPRRAYSREIDTLKPRLAGALVDARQCLKMIPGLAGALMRTTVRLLFEAGRNGWRVVAARLALYAALFFSVCVVSFHMSEARKAKIELAAARGENAPAANLCAAPFFAEVCEYLWPPVEIGRLVMEPASAREASFLAASAGDRLPREISGRVVYIGDYGDWAFVAPVRADGVAERFVVRRSKIIEFARTEPPPRDPPTVAADASHDAGERIAALERRMEDARRGELRRGEAALRASSAASDLARAALAGLDARASASEAARRSVESARAKLEAALRLEAARAASAEALAATGRRVDRLEAQLTELAIRTPFRLNVTLSLDELATRATAESIGDALSGGGDMEETRGGGRAILSSARRLAHWSAYRECMASNARPDFEVAFEHNAASAEGPAARLILDEAAAAVAERAGPASDGGAPTLVFLRGSASATGSSRHNLALSERRAKWVAARLGAALAEVSPDGAWLLVPFAAGESLPLRPGGGPEQDVNARVVEVRICQSAPTPRREIIETASESASR